MTTPSSLEARVAHLEGIFTGIEALLASIESRPNRVKDCIHSLEGRMRTKFQWMVGLLVSMWLTIILAILIRT